MLTDILAALWFFFPAGAANSAPVWVKLIPALRRFDHPIDGGLTWRGQRIFGEHKTVRGFVAGFVFALATLLLQRYLHARFGALQELSWIDYQQTNLWVLALLMSLGALGGDAIKSFLKRQFKRPPGTPWFPFDQADFIIGGLLAASLLVNLDWRQYLLVAAVWFVLHPLTTGVGYLLGMKERPI